MTHATTRAAMGFVAAVLAVLTFHQGMIWALGQAGFLRANVYSLAPVGPLRVPGIVNLCFWGGLYGVVYGLLWPWLRLPSWLSGLILGLIAALVGWFVVAPLKGNPVAAGWVFDRMWRSLLINGFWGLGVGLILPLLLRTGRRR